jgi:hypothetical protein
MIMTKSARSTVLVASLLGGCGDTSPVQDALRESSIARLGDPASSSRAVASRSRGRGYSVRVVPEDASVDCVASYSADFKSSGSEGFELGLLNPVDGDLEIPLATQFDPQDQQITYAGRFLWPDGVVGIPGDGWTRTHVEGDTLVVRVVTTLRCLDADPTGTFHYACEPMPLDEEFRLTLDRTSPTCDLAAGGSQSSANLCNAETPLRCVGEPPRNLED